MHTLLTVLQRVISCQYDCCTEKREYRCTAKRARSAGRGNWGRDSLERESADRVDRELVVLVGLERHLCSTCLVVQEGERRRDEEDRGSTR